MPIIRHVKKGDKAAPRQSAIHLIGPSHGSVRKQGEVAGLTVNGAESIPEDNFAGSYMTAGTIADDVSIIEPNIKPGALKALVQQNNTLAQAVEVMEVNIAGTGFTIEKVKEDGPDKEDQKTILTDFFNEPYPGKSFTEIERESRRDMEECGCGYLEVGSSLSGEVVTMNWLDADTMRLVRLDAPVWAEKPVTRAGKEIKVRVRVRERRFVQLVNGQKTYFREFGASRHLNRLTGKWESEGNPVKPDFRASEVIYLTVNKEPKTPYGSPRWINQLPSVLGSRKAEEHNLDFFDAGGMPPVLVLVQGGYLGSGVADDLRMHLSGTGTKHRAAVVEAMAASGSLDSAGSVKVTVERFGAERQQDGMFQNYDERCGEHVRSAFRLPPMFFGLSQDYNFATAMTAYMTAEAQVFAPERLEFDNWMNKVVKRLGVTDYRFKSNPISLTDVANQLVGIDKALTNKVVKAESAIKAINKVTGLNLEWQEPPAAPDPMALQDAKTKGAIDLQDNAHANSQVAADAAVKRNIELQKANPGASAEAGKPGKPKLAVVKGDRIEELDHAPFELVRLAEDYASVLGLNGFGFAVPGNAVDAELYIEGIKRQVDKLEGEPKKLFNAILASKSLVGVKPELDALGELCGCAAELVESDELVAEEA